MVTFNDLPMLAQAAHRALADSVDNVRQVDEKKWLISTAQLNPSAKTHGVVEQVTEWEGEHRTFLYYFAVTNEPADDLAEIEQAYKNAKEYSERAFARLNKSRSRCLYVGGSQNISQRLKEHLGFGNKRTYAMQLAHWAPRLELNVTFVCARYADTETPEIMQTLEDTLWATLTPRLGRHGKR